MTDDEQDEGEQQSTDFCLTPAEILILKGLTTPLRQAITRATPKFIKSAAVALLVLDQLPKVTPAAQVRIGRKYVQSPGNYGWVDITISEEEIAGTFGEHSYEPGFGGDTETVRVFATWPGAKSSRGDLEDWYANFTQSEGFLTLSTEETLLDDVDWGDD